MGRRRRDDRRINSLHDAAAASAWTPVGTIPRFDQEKGFRGGIVVYWLCLIGQGNGGIKWYRVTGAQKFSN
jgi:hypothetical protein